MTVKNMTVLRILKALDGIEQVHCLIEKNCVTVQVMDGEHADYEATEKQARTVQEALGDGWMWLGNGSLVILSYDPDGALNREHEAAMRDQLGPAYDAAFETA